MSYRCKALSGRGDVKHQNARNLWSVGGIFVLRAWTLKCIFADLDYSAVLQGFFGVRKYRVWRTISDGSVTAVLPR